jgi:dTDP-4-dehydrorhamnose reductase
LNEVRVVVTGAAGQLGSEVVAELGRRSAARRRGGPIDVLAVDHAALDVADRDAVLSTVLAYEPDIVVHAAAWTAVDACELDPDRAYAVNALGTRHVAEAARRCGAHLCYLSTDYVFEGTSGHPYREWDRPGPRSVYGRSKLGGELEAGRSATIVRTSWVCGRKGANIVKTVLRLLDGGSPLRFVDDQIGSPTIAHDLASVVVDLALARRPGIFHVTNQGSTSWYGFARAVVAFAGGDPDAVVAIRTSELDPPRPAARPAYSVLDNAALRLSGLPLLRRWEDSTRELVAELRSPAPR